MDKLKNKNKEKKKNTKVYETPDSRIENEGLVSDVFCETRSFCVSPLYSYFVFVLDLVDLFFEIKLNQHWTELNLNSIWIKNNLKAKANAEATKLIEKKK